MTSPSADAAKPNGDVPHSKGEGFRPSALGRRDGSKRNNRDGSSSSIGIAHLLPPPLELMVAAMDDASNNTSNHRQQQTPRSSPEALPFMPMSLPSESSGDAAATQPPPQQQQTRAILRTSMSLLGPNDHNHHIDSNSRHPRDDHLLAMADAPTTLQVRRQPPRLRQRLFGTQHDDASNFPPLNRQPSSDLLPPMIPIIRDCNHHHHSHNQNHEDSSNAGGATTGHHSDCNNNGTVTINSPIRKRQKRRSARMMLAPRTTASRDFRLFLPPTSACMALSLDGDEETKVIMRPRELSFHHRCVGGVGVVGKADRRISIMESSSSSSSTPTSRRTASTNIIANTKDLDWLIQRFPTLDDEDEDNMDDDDDELSQKVHPRDPQKDNNTTGEEQQQSQMGKLPVFRLRMRPTAATWLKDANTTATI